MHFTRMPDLLGGYAEADTTLITLSKCIQQLELRGAVTRCTYNLGLNKIFVDFIRITESHQIYEYT